MIYEFHCDACSNEFDASRPVAEYDRPENCPKCGEGARRIPFPRKIHLSQTAVQERYFNHALGTVCTDSEARKIAKSRGLIEVGNEKVEKHVKPNLHSLEF